MRRVGAPRTSDPGGHHPNKKEIRVMEESGGLQGHRGQVKTDFQGDNLGHSIREVKQMT
jgi:hypothetical protein